jgi:hypothetical protein
MAKARKSRKKAKKRTRTAKLKGRKVARRKTKRGKARKRGFFSSAMQAIGEARNLRSRLTGPDSFEDR